MSTTRQQVLDKAEDMFGFTPNLIEELSRHPGAARVYLEGNAILSEDGRLSEKERQAVILAVSVYNDCHYCTAAHRTVGRKAGIEQRDLDRIDRNELPEDERLKALVRATRLTLDKRGELDGDDLRKLEASGVDREALYEIIAVIGIKTISNYVNHINGTQIDEPFEAQATRKPPEAA